MTDNKKEQKQVEALKTSQRVTEHETRKQPSNKPSKKRVLAAKKK